MYTNGLDKAKFRVFTSKAFSTNGSLMSESFASSKARHAWLVQHAKMARVQPFNMARVHQSLCLMEHPAIAHRKRPTLVVFCEAPQLAHQEHGTLYAARGLSLFTTWRSIAAAYEVLRRVTS